MDLRIIIYVLLDAGCWLACHVLLLRFLLRCGTASPAVSTSLPQDTRMSILDPTPAPKTHKS